MFKKAAAWAAAFFYEIFMSCWAVSREFNMVYTNIMFRVRFYKEFKQNLSLFVKVRC